MKVAYIFTTNMALTFKLATMILPQIEENHHKVKVVGMMFFDDNIFFLSKKDLIGEKLRKIAKEKNILLMVCDQWAIRRNLAKEDFSQYGKKPS